MKHEYNISIDRAIEILNPEHRERYNGIEEVNEACRMGMEALRELRDRENAEDMQAPGLRWICTRLRWKSGGRKAGLCLP